MNIFKEIYHWFRFKDFNHEVPKIRQSGRTTRLADQYIQELFETGSIKIKDHHDSHHSHNRLRIIIHDRLQREHPQVLRYLNVSATSISFDPILRKSFNELKNIKYRSDNKEFYDIDVERFIEDNDGYINRVRLIYHDSDTDTYCMTTGCSFVEIPFKTYVYPNTMKFISLYDWDERSLYSWEEINDKLRDLFFNKLTWNHKSERYDYIVIKSIRINTKEIEIKLIQRKV